jgi:hypothetical protein
MAMCVSISTPSNGQVLMKGAWYEYHATGGYVKEIKIK